MRVVIVGIELDRNLTTVDELFRSDGVLGRIGNPRSIRYEAWHRVGQRGTLKKGKFTLAKKGSPLHITDTRNP